MKNKSSKGVSQLWTLFAMAFIASAIAAFGQLAGIWDLPWW